MNKQTSRTGSFVLVFGLLALLSAAPGLSAREPRYWEVGIQAGFFLPDRDLSGKPEQFSELEPEVGLRGGYLFADRWGWFLDATWADFNTNTPAGDADLLTGRTGIEWFSRPHTRKLQWFVAAGGGSMDVALENPAADDFNRSFASASFGQRVALDQRAHFRWELRGDMSLSDSGAGGEDIDQLHALIGVTWRLGHIDRDSDGDGVQDGKDRCPDTPRGAIVDEDGCPKDSDGDGVWDGIDKCPDTPRGATVDARGCPKDSDGDGVWDGIDQCPDTPRGATVDARGCPKDSDGDGVYDGIDQCPDTPRGATVDAKGCPKDSDGDGVYDGIDQCPDTPRGATVDARGCPKDTDGDGVYDGIDRCPNTPKGAPVNAEGCPKSAPLFSEQKQSLILEGVTFELNKAVLTRDSRAVLDRVAGSLRDWPEVHVEVGGHTDSSGSDAYNLDLSQRRALAVKEYLAGQGVQSERMTVQGYGEGVPITDNGTEGGRAKNRRVELRKR